VEFYANTYLPVSTALCGMAFSRPFSLYVHFSHPANGPFPSIIPAHIIR